MKQRKAYKINLTVLPDYGRVDFIGVKIKACYIL